MHAQPVDRLPGRSVSWAVLFFLVLTIVCTWPMARDVRDHVQDRGDPLLQVVLLAWATDALLTPGDAWLDTPQFHPYRDTGVYQTSMLGQVPLFAPVYRLSGNPVLAVQASFLATLFLSGLCMWAYVRRITGLSTAGLLAGLVFAFHQYRFRNLQHMQVMSIWWWPLALWALEDFLTTRRWRSALALGACAVGQLYCSVYMTFMLGLIVGIRCVVECVAEPGRLSDRTLWRRGGLVLLLAGVAVAPLLLAYLRVARQFPPAHDLDTIVQFSAAPRDYLRVGLSSVPYYWLRARAAWQYTFEQHVLFPGLVPVALALYGFVAAEALGRRTQGAGQAIRRRAFSLVLTAALGIVLSLGPYLKYGGQATDIPLPAFALLTYVPGYAIFRVNTRFAFLLLFALSIGVGRAYAALATRPTLSDRGRKLLFGGIAALLLLENWNAPVPTVRVPVGDDLPPVYAALAEEATGRGPVLHVPFGRNLYEEIERVYGGLRHRRPMVNGYSTVQPPGYLQLAALARRGPTPAFLTAAVGINADTLVVHYDAMPPAEAARWRAARMRTGIHVVREFAGVDVWKLALDRTFLDQPVARLSVPPLAAGATATVPLRFSTPPQTAWRCPRPLGQRDATVTWQPLGSGALVEEPTRVRVPLFVVWTQPMEVPLRLHAPLLPGEYTLRVDCGVAVAEAPVQVLPPRAPDAAG